MSFYFREKRREDRGHPEVYLIESQDIQNQFSFWPRYDAFVDAPKKSSPEEGDVYSEEDGVNPFAGRSALFIEDGDYRDVPRNITQAFQTVEKVGTVEVRRSGRPVRTLSAFVCKNYRTLPL